MDAAAYLKKQGWRGVGHSLDHTDRGISKPLPLSKKIDVLGVGIQKYAAVSDQWWLRAYDQGLKELGSGKETALASAQKHGVGRGGLYAHFVKGAPLAGTIHEDVKADELEKVTKKARDTTLSKKHQLGQHETSGIIKRKRVEGKTKPDGVDHAKLQIRAYVNEAIRRGIIPPKSAVKSKSQSPCAIDDRDMEIVLKLARLNRGGKSDASALSDRKKMVRSLKRAAMKHMEQSAIASIG